MSKKNTKKIDTSNEEIIEETAVEDIMIAEEMDTPVLDEDTDSAAIEKDETPVVNKYTSDVKYREVVYLGVADTCERVGAVTGVRYTFVKDSYGMPMATHVDERDYPSIISERGRGCARRDASLVFMSKLEWDLEIEQARVANNS